MSSDDTGFYRVSQWVWPPANSHRVDGWLNRIGDAHTRFP